MAEQRECLRQLQRQKTDIKSRCMKKNEKLGKKIFITGKGRCNITNASDIQNHFANIMRNSKFLYSAYNNFSYEDICNMIESAGVKTKIERGNRVFPEK